VDIHLGEAHLWFIFYTINFNYRRIALVVETGGGEPGAGRDVTTWDRSGIGCVFVCVCLRSAAWLSVGRSVVLCCEIN